MKKILALFISIVLMPVMSPAQVIVDDTWADGGRSNGADLQDTDWWYSTSSSAIEVGVGFLGLVSGTSGRGIHGTFASQPLNIGDTLTVTFTFTTPATVGTAKTSAFRVGLFDTTGKPGLAADINASSGSPNAVYNNLSGYMMDLDVNNSPADDISFRQRTNALSGQLMATTADFEALPSGSGGTDYTFAANTNYTGVLSLTRTGTDTLELTGTLFQGATQLSTYTATDSSGITSSFGLLAFHVNSTTFGSSATVNAPDNGIDFTEIKVEYLPVPEPSILALCTLGAGLLFCRRSRSAH